MIPDKNIIRNILSKNGLDREIRSTCEQAHLQLDINHPDHVFFYRSSSRRSLIWELWVRLLIKATENHSNVSISKRNDTIRFLVVDGDNTNTVIISLKKADAQLRTSSIPTSAVKNYFDHRNDDQGNLFGCTGEHRVQAVYVLNSCEKIAWVGIVAKSNDEILWHYALDRNTLNVVGTTKLQIASKAPKDKAADAVVVPKTGRAIRKPG